MLPIYGFYFVLLYGGYNVVKHSYFPLCIIGCTSCFVMHEIIICLNPRWSIVEFVHSSVWIIGTSDGCNLPLFAKIS